jgi:hypothetical protein
MKRTRAVRENEIDRKKSKIVYEDENKENISENMPKTEIEEPKIPSPMKLSILLPKALNYYDNGYETDETVPEEKYVSPADYKPPEKSAYQRYLEETDIRNRNYDDGYETDDTVIVGGKKRATHRRHLKVKKTKRKQYRRKTQRKQRKHKRKTHRK